ncbi:DUF2628 domain-containing protein [Lacticaseibacillus songhuajiangensis]|jgi:hypothetical protein|uniref:DUF2628 domain-containing protein n=1 Tax=Lacticaseibacillus songhuajiangensis TaxID=1296539 RepID=UPI000F7A6B31|nr:DUF2628 domain-containing protein [Lacticaseibacillus songhuajiangensis]MCI1284287.1 DUF2628 domain-containing protein [Lacticaseibacillus songhuajiangensis]
MFVTLTNARTGQARQAKIGFSWTTFFFGFFPALFRSDWKWALIIAVLQIATGAFTFGISTGIISIIFAFIYNKLYINDLIANGYEPASSADADVMRMKGFVVR